MRSLITKHSFFAPGDFVSSAENKYAYLTFGMTLYNSHRDAGFALMDFLFHVTTKKN